MKVIFNLEKITKNTIRFAEVTESDLTAPKIGTIYIPKGTLGEIGWVEGKRIMIDFYVEGDA